jgi:hypothetical protein
MQFQKFFQVQTNYLTIVSFGWKIFLLLESHPLKCAWNCLVKTSKNIIITETLETGQSENIPVINQKIKFTYKNEMTIDIPNLNFENSQDIVINTIKSIISEKENMIKIGSAKYTKMMLFILTSLFSSNHPIGSSSCFSKNQDSTCTRLNLFHQTFTIPLWMNVSSIQLLQKNVHNGRNNRRKQKFTDASPDYQLYHVDNLFPQFKSDGFGFSRTLFLNDKLSFSYPISVVESILFASQFWTVHRHNYTKMVSFCIKSLLECFNHDHFAVKSFDSKRYLSN